MQQKLAVQESCVLFYVVYVVLCALVPWLSNDKLRVKNVAPLRNIHRPSKRLNECLLTFS